jgi:hypothetical protein
VEEHERQKGALLDATERERAIVLENLQGAEEPEVHAPSTAGLLRP